MDWVILVNHPSSNVYLEPWDLRFIQDSQKCSEDGDLIEKRFHFEVGGDMMQHLDHSTVDGVAIAMVICQHQAVHTHNLVIGKSAQANDKRIDGGK